MLKSEPFYYSVIVLLATVSSSELRSQDLEFPEAVWLEPFSYSTVLEIEIFENQTHDLVTGTLQRTRGEVNPEDSRRLQGEVVKTTYEIDQEFSGIEVYEFYREQIFAKGHEILFECSGRACGSSNYWANDIFGKRSLYGPVMNQFYIAVRRSSAEEYISLYIITRGNKKVYAYLESVKVDEVGLSSGERSILSRALTEGSVILPNIQFSNSHELTAETDVMFLYEFLKENPSVFVYLVAHLAAGLNESELMLASTKRAEALVRELVALGVDPKRILPRGVGPLAPNCYQNICKNRVELVVRN